MNEVFSRVEVRATEPYDPMPDSAQAEVGISSYKFSDFS